MNNGTISVQKTDVGNVWGYFAGPSAKDSEKGTRKGKEWEEKAPPKAPVKQATKGGGDGESSGVERSHRWANFQRLKAGGAKVATMAAQGVDPNPPKAPQCKSPKEASEEEGDEVEDVDNGSQEEEGDEEEEDEKPLKKHKGKGKSKKDLKTHFMLHGPAKGGAKAIGTNETEAKVNTRPPHLEQLYRRTSAIWKDECLLGTTELRHHFINCLVPCSAIIAVHQFSGKKIRSPAPAPTRSG